MRFVYYRLNFAITAFFFNYISYSISFGLFDLFGRVLPNLSCIPCKFWTAKRLLTNINHYP